MRSGFWGTWSRRNEVCFLLTDGGSLSGGQTNKLPPFCQNKKASVGGGGGGGGDISICCQTRR